MRVQDFILLGLRLGVLGFGFQGFGPRVRVLHSTKTKLCDPSKSIYDQKQKSICPTQ